MDLQNRMAWEPGHFSNSPHKTNMVNAWSKEEKVKREILQDSKDSEYTSMKVYMKGILKQSLITSVPEITVTKSWTKKIIKTMVFILCLVGFIYQSLEFLQIYLSYPTVSSVTVSNPYRFIQPAITICNRNRLRRSEICKNRFLNCTYVSKKKLCEKFPKYCVRDGREPFTGVIEQAYLLERYISRRQASIAAHNESMIYTCVKVRARNRTLCKKPYRRVPVTTTYGLPNFCYTIESLWGEPEGELQMYPNNLYFYFVLHMQPEEYIVHSRQVTIQLALHDRRRLVNPYLDGYTLRGGVDYQATVSMTEKKLLPAPYNTNCTDYIKLWRENNGTGPMNNLQCIEYCKLNSLLKEGKCIDMHVAYPNTKELCKLGKYSITDEISENCRISCGRPCYDYSYDVKFEEVDNFNDKCDNDWCRLKMIRLKMHFNQFQLTKTHYQPKFESVELFSYIGGYMGMWLGLSLVAIFDFLETLFHIVYFPIGRWRQRTRRRKIRHTFKRDEVGEWRPQIY